MSYLVSNYIPFGSFQRKTLFSEGHINLKMLPLKLVRLSELRMFSYSILPKSKGIYNFGIIVLL